MKTNRVCQKCTSIKYYAKGLCKSCYTKQLILSRWSKKFPACVKCGTTVSHHVAHGLCERCYNTEKGGGKLCECGCGNYTSMTRGKPKRFLHGHWARTLATNEEWKSMMSKKMSKEGNPCYGLYKENHPAFNHFTSEELRETRRQTRLKYMSKPENRRTSIEIILHNLLEELCFEHIPQHIIGNKFSVDEFLPKYNAIIEAFGDFWHSNPEKYSDNNMTPTQKKIKIKDQSKMKYLESCGYKILILWEKELNQSPNICKQKISLFIEHQVIPQL